MKITLTILILCVSVILSCITPYVNTVEAADWWVYSLYEGRIHTYVDDTTVFVGKNRYSAVIKYVEEMGKGYVRTPKYYFWKDHERNVWMVSDVGYELEGAPVERLSSNISGFEFYPG